RYELIELLGKGSMGEVWRGVDPRIGRPVAVKLLEVASGLSPEDREEWSRRFIQEARAAGRVSHPSIIAIHDVGVAEDGRPFIVMEHVAGTNLESVLEKGPQPDLKTALEWGIQLAEALDAAHRQGVVHRDIKPANILVGEDGRVRIADFGLARMPESDLTREGSFVGTPSFCSPEQVRGLPVDGRSDVFSLGAVMYTLLTGIRPFTGKEWVTLTYEVCHVTPLKPRCL